jgi:hypothetical protein
MALQKEYVTQTSQAMYKIDKRIDNPVVHHITTIVSSFGRNIPNTVLRGHHPHQVYLQPKE